LGRSSPTVGEVFGKLPALETERLVLRRVRLADAEDVFAYASDPEVTRYLSWETHRSVEDSREFLRSLLERYRKGEPASWGLVYKASGRFVGTGGFDAGVWTEHARAEVGCVISGEVSGLGLGTEALRAMISFGFKELGLNRVEARCVSGNVASARIMEKADMTHEGTAREKEFSKGAYRDMESYAILRRDYHPA
jgi:ribosomal-protein-alanine N-acetyltransferase